MTTPKAELHVHLEGTATPELVRRLAARHGMTLPASLFDAEDRFQWRDFLHFLAVYDQAASVIRTEEDYRDVTFEYLGRCAAEGAVYVEVMSSPDHAAQAGLFFAGHLAGIVQGMVEARERFGIEARLIVTCVRHFGVERGIAVARACAHHRHPLLTGFGMGGDEACHPAAAFRHAFAIAHHEAGLACTVHAGEFAGPQSVREAVANLPVVRVGHGVRAAEDADLLRLLAERRVVLEVCPTSNVRTRVYPDYAAHPLKALIAAGCAVTLNSDDPPYFDTTIGGEYAVATQAFGLDEAALAGITRTAVEGAFVDEATRQRLRARLAGDAAAKPG